MTTTEPSATEPLTAEATLEVLRRRPETIELLGGFGPLTLAAALLLAMVLIVPSVAPERTVERLVQEPATAPVGAP
jgi:hypothetical protein